MNFQLEVSPALAMWLGGSIVLYTKRLTFDSLSVHIPYFLDCKMHHPPQNWGGIMVVNFLLLSSV